MTVAEFVSVLLSSTVVSTAVMGVVIWLARNVATEHIKNSIKHEYDLKLESHKVALAAENSQAIERLRAELQIAAAERHVRFSALHEKVAETVAGLHERLQLLHSAVAAYTSIIETGGMGSRENRREAAQRALKEFSDYFRARKLYIPKALATAIRDFAQQIHDAAWSFLNSVDTDEFRRNDKIEKWGEIHEVMAGTVPLLAEMEDEFRKLLGVE